MRAFQRSGLGLRPQQALRSTNPDCFGEPVCACAARLKSFSPNEEPPGFPRRAASIKTLTGYSAQNRCEKVSASGRKRGGFKLTFLDVLNNRYQGRGCGAKHFDNADAHDAELKMCHIASGLWLAEPEQLDRAAPMSWWRRRVFKTCRGTQMPHTKKKKNKWPGAK